MTRFFSYGLVPVLLFLCACGDATEPVEQVQDEAAVHEAIRATWEQFNEVFEQGDAAALASFYTEDAINMPSFESTQNGPAEVEAMFASLLSSSTVDVLSQTTDEIFVHDGMAYELGSLEFEQKSKSVEEDTEIRRVRYVSVFKQQSDGTWKFHRWLGQQQTSDSAT